MKSLWNILDDEPLAVGYTYNNYVSVEFSFLLGLPYLKCVFFVALFQFGFELVIVHV